MAYTSRSLQGVRQVTPESSRLLRESERFTGAAKAEIQGAAAKAAMYEVGRGTGNPATQAAEDAGKRAIMAGQQIAAQGEFRNEDVVSPLRQDFFDSTDPLPLHQKMALYNRYTPELSKQNILRQQEQKSYLQLKEAQRQARLAQASDALQAPVSQRLEEIMGSGANNKTKFSQIQQSLFDNPQALGNPILNSLYSTAFKQVGDKLDAKQARKNMEQTMNNNMIYQATRLGQPDVIKALSAQGKKGKDRYKTAIALAGSTAASEAAKRNTASLTALIGDVSKLDPSGIRKQIPLLSKLATTPLQQLQVEMLGLKATEGLKSAGQEAQLESLTGFTALAKMLRSGQDSGEDTSDTVDKIVSVIKAQLKEEGLNKLVGDETKLSEIDTLDDLIIFLSAAANGLAKKFTPSARVDTRTLRQT